MIFRNLRLILSLSLISGCSIDPNTTKVLDWHLVQLASSTQPHTVTAIRAAWINPRGELLLSDSRCDMTLSVANLTQASTTHGADLFRTSARAIAECEAQVNLLSVGISRTWCQVVLINEDNVCATEKPKAISRARTEYSSEKQIAESRASGQRENQCREFGFVEGTPEMANCLLELYKIENQPQQNTVIANPAPNANSAPNPAAGIELMNRGLQILNGAGTPSAPAATSSSRCTRIGDISRQVYTFNSPACPAGYAPAF